MLDSIDLINYVSTLIIIIQNALIFFTVVDYLH